MIKACSLFLSLAIIFVFTAGPALAQPQAQPEITIVSVEVSPQFAEPGRQITASVRVKNISGVATTCFAGLNFQIYSSNEYGNPYGEEFISAISGEIDNINILPPNFEATITATVPLYHEGPHTVNAWLNTELCAPGEMSVLDGNLKKSFHVTRPADLVMDGSRLNSNGHLVLTMHNAGASIPDDHFNESTIKVKIGSDIYTDDLTAADPSGRLQNPNLLGIGNRVTYVWPTSGPQGIVLPVAERQKVKVTVDDNRSINDHRRWNNTRENYVGGKPDLVVCFKKFNHSDGGQNSWYSPVVKNIGNARSGSANLRLYIENKGGTNHSIPSLSAGGEYRGIQRRVYWAVRGNHRFKLYVDNQDDVDNESNEHNNIINGNICVGPWWIGRYDSCGAPSQTLCSDVPGMADTDW